MDKTIDLSLERLDDVNTPLSWEFIAGAVAGVAVGVGIGVLVT